MDREEEAFWEAINPASTKEQVQRASGFTICCEPEESKSKIDVRGERSLGSRERYAQIFFNDEEKPRRKPHADLSMSALSARAKQALRP